MKNDSSFFEKIAQKPLSWMVLSYPVLVLALIIFGFFYSRHANNILQNGIPPILKDSLSVIPEIPVAEPKVASAIDVKTLTEPTAEMIAKGKELFQASCASCHGAEGKGDGVAGAALNPKPRNFHAPDNEGWKNGRKLTQLYKTLQFGIPGSGMGAYDYMSPSDRIDIIAFIRATFMVNPPVDAAADITALENTYKLSLGTQIPGSLPVAGASLLVQQNSADVTAKLNTALSMQLTPEKSSLLKAYIADKNKAFSTLLNNPGWQQDKSSMVKIISMNIAKNGFKGSAVLAGQEDLNALYSLLREILG